MQGHYTRGGFQKQLRASGAVSVLEMDDIELIAIKTIDDDRRVAHVRVGELLIKSLWVIGLRAGKPRVSWPETARGYLIVEPTQELRLKIDALVLGTGAKSRAKIKAPRQRRRPSRSKWQAPTLHVDDPNDPLEDLFRGGLA